MAVWVEEASLRTARGGVARTSIPPGADGELAGMSIPPGADGISPPEFIAPEGPPFVAWGGSPKKLFSQIRSPRMGPS